MWARRVESVALAWVGRRRNRFHATPQQGVVIGRTPHVWWMWTLFTCAVCRGLATEARVWVRLHCEVPNRVGDARGKVESTSRQRGRSSRTHCVCWVWTSCTCTRCKAFAGIARVRLHLGPQISSFLMRWETESRMVTPWRYLPVNGCLSCSAYQMLSKTLLRL